MITEILLGFCAMSLFVVHINLFLITKRIDRFSIIADLLMQEYIGEAMAENADKEEENTK